MESLTLRATGIVSSSRPRSWAARHTIHGSLVRHDPPTPTLGSRMLTFPEPLGIVFAAAITSSTSTFSVAQSLARSLASAMLWSIHQLPASFTISALSSDEQGTISTPRVRRQNAAAAAPLSAHHPPTTIG